MNKKYLRKEPTAQRSNRASGEMRVGKPMSSKRQQDHRVDSKIQEADNCRESEQNEQAHNFLVAKSSYEHFIESAKRSHQETTRPKGRVGSKGQWKRLRKSSDNIRAPTATATRDDAEAARQQKKVKHKTSCGPRGATNKP